MSPDAEPDDATEADSAEQAFAALRAEVAALRRDVAALGTAQGEPAGPDYAPTLGAIVQELQGIGQRLGGIEAHPALTMTPEAYARRLSAAEEDGRREGGKGLWEVQGQIATQARALEAIVGVAHTRQEQRLWLACVGGLGVVLGMLVWLVVVVPLIGAVSQSWADTIAATDLDATPWNAGMGLMQRADPQSWNALVDGWSIRQAGGATLQACYAAMQKSGTAQRCTVTLRPVKGK